MNEVHLDPSLHIEPITFDQAKQFDKSVRAELKGYQDAGVLSAEQVRFERGYLSNLSVYDFWGCRWWAAVDPGIGPVGIHAAKFSTTRRKNAWGRYINVYLAFTRPSFRQSGVASSLELHIEAEALADGYDRIKTTCQSWLGFGYHERCRHQFWGVNDKGELILDTPLHDGVFPPGVPIEARKWNSTGKELSADDLLAVLTDPSGRFARQPGEVLPILGKRVWRRAEARAPRPDGGGRGIETADAGPTAGTPSTAQG